MSRLPLLVAVTVWYITPAVTQGSTITLVTPATAANMGPYPSVLPTSSAQPGEEAVFSAAQTAPTIRQVPSGQCAANFAAGQQCGGNMTNSAANCAEFNSCAAYPEHGAQWTGGCCPTAAQCTPLATSGNFCWSCGGGVPASIQVATDNAAAMAEKMCTRQSSDADFDYGCVLGASLLFYEAQRSGKLPPNNRVPWRGDSALLDQAPNGASLVGGWYDAGDLTRFTFPAAFTVSTLALAYLEFPQTFEKASQTQWMLSTLKWGADWLLQARYAPDAFVAVTWMPGSTVGQSHLYWGRPEDVPGAATVRALTAGMKGADLLAQGAAALAAVSVVFQQRDPTYANELLSTARELYDQATDPEYAGLYSNSIPEVQGYYDSYSYIDDLAWAATWLAIATDDAEQWEHAVFYYNQHWQMEGGGEGRRFDYNNMVQAVGYLLAKHEPARKEEYSKPIRDVMNLWLTAQSNITYTAKLPPNEVQSRVSAGIAAASSQGMAYIDSWGNLRYVANQAFMGLLHNKLYPEQSHRSTVYTCFARKQARIMLGETGPSFVVGVGNNPPCRPHHRAASCVSPSAPGLPCDCTAYYSTGCNPNVIYGALVGGPDKSDTFTDTRWEFQASEVALDWNAGFTGMLAGLADNAVSWETCKAAGMEDGRGNVSPSLNASGQTLPLRWCWQVLAAAGVVLLMAMLQQQH